jgi:Protein of unknown function (DUF3014)
MIKNHTGVESMKKTNLIIFTLLILIVALGTAIYLKDTPVSDEPIVSVQPPPPPAQPIKKPIVHYPVPEVITQSEKTDTQQAETSKPDKVPALPVTLPKIEKSDQSIQDVLEDIVDNQTLYKLLFMENFIQRVVATIDNLPEKQLPRAHLPIKPPGGKYFVSGTTEAPQTSSRNHQRYSPYLSLFESLDQDLVMKIYVHFYPLFQTAYEQLGYKNAYFNDRLVYVISHLLETPNPPDPILLAQPAVLYTYADPLLEKRSSGQKILLRLGQDQRTEALKLLRTYKQKLTSLKF